MNSEEPLRALAATPGEAWLVGGALRDLMLGRPTTDYDVAVAGDPASLARTLARQAGGHAFLLSEGFGGWRVVARRRDWQVDVLPVVGGGIEKDLAARDFTVNALALPLRALATSIPDFLATGVQPRVADGLPGLIDPYQGLADLRGRLLRMVSAQAFERDPLRTLRLARLVSELAFAVDPAAREAARRSVARIQLVAAERVFGEFKRIVSSDRPLAGLDEMDTVGATEVVLPELAALRGVRQNQYHHLDVYQHTRAVLTETMELVRDPRRAFGQYGEAVRAFLEQPLSDDLTRAQALRFGALLHDIAKPPTRAVTSEGRVTFLDHDVRGAELASEVLGRLRASERLRQHVAALTKYHLTLGFLVHRAPLGRREIYRYLHDSEPVQIDVTALSIADRLATRGEGSGRAIDNHLAVARQVIAEALHWSTAPPRAPIRGDELARRLGIRPGPELGRILEELREASFAGEVRTRDEALELAARLHRRP